MDTKKNLKIAMIGDYPLDNRRINSGVQAVITYLTEALNAMDNLDLHILTFKPRINNYSMVEKDGFCIHVIPSQRFGNLTFYRFDYRNLRYCLSKIRPDIVHAQGATKEGYLTLKSGYPAVITFHGMIGEDAKFKSTYIQQIRLALISYICENSCVRNASHAILISPYVKNHFGKKLKAKTYYLPNPVKSDFFQLPDTEKKGQVLFAGRITPIKGILDLLKAIHAIRERIAIQLVLAGSLDDETYINLLREYINNHNMTEYISFKGLLNEQQLLEEFKFCSLLVLPSYQENSPMVIQQAMAAGKPVIAARVGGIPYMVDAEITGLLFKPGDIAALSKHLVALLGSYELRKKMGFKAREKALANYQAKEIANKTMGIYHEVIMDYQR